jgi:hypothetical protein
MFCSKVRSLCEYLTHQFSVDFQGSGDFRDRLLLSSQFHDGNGFFDSLLHSLLPALLHGFLVNPAFANIVYLQHGMNLLTV